MKEQTKKELSDLLDTIEKLIIRIISIIGWIKILIDVFKN